MEVRDERPRVRQVGVVGTDDGADEGHVRGRDARRLEQRLVRHLVLDVAHRRVRVERRVRVVPANDAEVAVAHPLRGLERRFRVHLDVDVGVVDSQRLDRNGQQHLEHRAVLAEAAGEEADDLDLAQVRVHVEDERRLRVHEHRERLPGVDLYAGRVVRVRVKGDVVVLLALDQRERIHLSERRLVHAAPHLGRHRSPRPRALQPARRAFRAQYLAVLRNGGCDGGRVGVGRHLRS
mmetsp:Transcript_25259/g.88119  ORF Transcript_25259/g.88119 Transcript_25259/m.88119 type:complete len:236 (-) Transcript_25259:136-843(-)